MKIVRPTLLAPMKAVSSISIQPTGQNFQELMVSKMPGMPVLINLVSPSTGWTQAWTLVRLSSKCACRD